MIISKRNCVAALGTAFLLTSGCGAYDPDGSGHELDLDTSFEGESSDIVPSDAEEAEPVEGEPSDGEENVGSVGEGLVTSFTPVDDGLNFNNEFKTVTVANVVTGGLCGGMVYTALDYFYSSKAVPRQNYRPAPGTALRNHILSRQVQSLMSNLDKWGEMGANPLGVRNDELWRWGLQATGRVAELRRALDAGKATPLGLQACGGCAVGNHQVLALSYTLGAYSAALQGYPDLRITVYDPSKPDVATVLRTDTTTRRWYDAADTSRRWLTYFVDANYVKAVPPSVISPVSGLLLTIKTGADDLRGGTDNFNVKLTMRNGSVQTFNNRNLSQRWIDGVTEQVSIPVAVPADVVKVTLTTTFGGGLFGDNWNVDRLRIHNIENSRRADSRYDKSGTPLRRFTGDLQSYSVTLNTL